MGGPFFFRELLRVRSSKGWRFSRPGPGWLGASTSTAGEKFPELLVS